MARQITWLFRSPSGRIASARGESAHEAAHQLGQVLSWDGDLNTLDIVRHGKTEVWTFLGHREQAVEAKNKQYLAHLRRIIGGQVLSVRATWDSEGFGSRPIVKETK